MGAVSDGWSNAGCLGASRYRYSDKQVLEQQHTDCDKSRGSYNFGTIGKNNARGRLSMCWQCRHFLEHHADDDVAFCGDCGSLMQPYFSADGQLRLRCYRCGQVSIGKSQWWSE
jgi:NADH pyrophosphatase NudC (nudix superfamily)